MNLPVIVDIVIGLVFIYLILSLLASEIQELIATFLQWRAKHLKESVELLLAGGSQTGHTEITNAEKLVQELYNDPLINTLNQQAKNQVAIQFREITKKIDRTTLGEKQSAPSYLPSETFAISLLQALKIPALIEHVKNPSQEVKTNLHMILATYKELQTGINDPNSESYKKIENIYGSIDDDFKNLVNSLPDYVPDNLITSLIVIAQRSRLKIDDLREEVNQFKNEIETWFDRSMERASGVYKRNAKGVAILIGISVAVLTNTDTVYLLKRLSQDSVIRSAITQSASQRTDFINDKNATKNIESVLRNASVPIGWQNISQQFELSNNTFTNSINVFFIRIWQVFKLIFGWTVSGLAVAMGAPFWFDILNKFVNVRNTGPKPVSYTKDQPPQQ